MSNKKTVLCLFAHPDDETFGPGGTLAKLSAEGHTVRLVCATRGESGTIDKSSSFGRRRLAEVRFQELLAACDVLGIDSPWIYTFPDSGLIRLEEETLLRPFVHAIRAFRPDAIITFHEDGISGHNDHRTVTARAKGAYHLASDGGLWPDLGPSHEVQRFWEYTVSESRAAMITTRKIHSTPDDELDADIDTSEHVAAKKKAVEAHATQKLFVENLENSAAAGFMWKKEGFLLTEARTPLPEPTERPVDDLFLGL